MLKNLLRLILYLTGFAAVGAIAAFMLFKLIDLDKTVKVPLLVGRSIAEATELLTDSGLYIEIEGEKYEENIPPGNIISQGIKYGGKIKKGSSVSVFVSKEKVVSIPSFENMHVKDIKPMLKGTDIEIRKITKVHSDTVKKNRVITQRPLPGNFSDNKVNLVVSLGPYNVSYRCPSFINMTTEEAAKVAATLGIKLIKHDRGRVIVFQKPEAGAIIKKGDSVDITLGRGGGFSF